MSKLALAVMVALAAPVSNAQPVQAPEIQPSVDSTSERVGLRNLSACLAKARPRWARQTLAHPYLSKEQASIASNAMGGRDNCVRGAEAAVTVRTSGLVSGLAEHFLATELPTVGLPRVSAALVKAEPRNASEDFALCLASRNPRAAQAMAMSEPGSTAESDAAKQVALGVKACTNPGENPTVDMQALRALVSTALYRGLTSAQG